MKEYLCAFSSDYRELYKADIYKTLSMPSGSLIHFRYKFKYIDENILSDPNKYKGKEVIIFYTNGNKDQEGVLENIPVRKAKLYNVEKSSDTELFHVYIELKEFCNIEMDKTSGDNKLIPPDKFFSSIKCTNEIATSWKEKVEKLHVFFPDLSFYYLKSIKNTLGLHKYVRRGKNSNKSFFRMLHGNKYIAELSIANPNQTSCVLDVFSSSDDVSINYPVPIETSAFYDDITVPIYIKSLNVFSETSFLSFKPKNSDKVNSEYILNIEIKKKLGFFRPVIFGVFALLAAISIWIIEKQSDSFTNIGKDGMVIDWILLVSCITFFIS